MLLGEAYRIESNQGSLGVTARFVSHLLGVLGPLGRHRAGRKGTENVKIIHLFVMFKEDSSIYPKTLFEKKT